MSHVHEGTVVYRDLDAFRVAVERCGGVFLEGQTSFHWWGRWAGDWREAGSAFAAGRDPKTFGQCAHAFKVTGTDTRNGSSGPWSVGLVPALDGDGFCTHYDNFGSAGKALEAVFGVGMERLAEEYAAEVAIRQLVAAGYMTERIDAPRQTVRR